MSGGHWNYSSLQLQEALESIGEDSVVQQRWPKTAEMFRALGAHLAALEHDMDWDISDDQSINDDGAFDHTATLKALRLMSEIVFPASGDEGPENCG